MPKYYREGETPTPNAEDPRAYFEWYLNNPEMNNPQKFVSRYRKLQAQKAPRVSESKIFEKQLERDDQLKNLVPNLASGILEDLREIWTAKMQSLLDSETAALSSTLESPSSASLTSSPP